MVTKEDLKEYAANLMFDMDDAGYDRTLEEFEVLEKHMDLISKIEGIENVEPIPYPFIKRGTLMRKDCPKECLTKEEVLKNAKDVKVEQIKVPKVVG